MKVEVYDICSVPSKKATLPDVSRVGFHSSIRAKVVAAYADDGGITIHVYGPFVVACNSSVPGLYHQYLVIKEPPCSV